MRFRIESFSANPFPGWTSSCTTTAFIPNDDRHPKNLLSLRVIWVTSPNEAKLINSHIYLGVSNRRVLETCFQGIQQGESAKNGHTVKI